MAVAPTSISRVETVAEVDALPEFEQPVALLAQTTLSHRDWEGVAVRVRERFPDVWTPGRSDLCFATTNRQSSLLAMVERCDAVVIIGSSNSSNTRALEKLAREAGCDRVHRVNLADQVPDDLVRHGRRDRRRLRPRGAGRCRARPTRSGAGRRGRLGHRRGRVLPPPRNIRDLQAAIEVACTSMVGGTLLTRPAMDDRSLPASDVLASL